MSNVYGRVWEGGWMTFCLFCHIANGKSGRSGNYKAHIINLQLQLQTDEKGKKCGIFHAIPFFLSLFHSRPLRLLLNFSSFFSSLFFASFACTFRNIEPYIATILPEFDTFSRIFTSEIIPICK